MKIFLDVAGLIENLDFNASRSGIFRANEILLEALTQETQLDVQPVMFSRLHKLHKFALNPACDIFLEPWELGEPDAAKKISYHQQQEVFRFKGLSKKLQKAVDWQRHARLARSLTRTDAIWHSPTLKPFPEKFTHFGVHRFFTVYDLTPMLFPEFFKGTPVVSWFSQFLRSITPDDFVFCCSESTRRDLLSLRPDMDPARVFVNYLAASPFFRFESTKPAFSFGDKPYFLAACTIEPRKNIPLLVDAFSRFVQQTKNREVVLVLCGAPGWQYAQTLTQAMEHVPPKLKRQIHFTQHVSDSLLRSLYSHCLAFVYPSKYEGFGLPILEAMACGSPVIVSNVSSIPEVVGKAGRMFAPSDRDGFSGEMEKICSSQTYRERLSHSSLKQARKFTLDRMAKLTMAGYRSAYTSN